MKKLFLSLFLLGCLITGTSCGSNNKQQDSKEQAKEENEKNFNGSGMADDINFLIETASAGLMEVQLGQLAQQKGLSPKVKEFGETMIEEHSKVNEDLKQLAAKKNVSIPIKPGEKDLKQVKELSSLQGSNFDKAYMKTIVQNHEKDIARFQIQAEKGKDPEIKAFATNTLSDLLLQLEVATTINNSLKED